MQLPCTFRFLTVVTATIGLSVLAHKMPAQENRNQVNLLLLPTSQRAVGDLQQSCSLWSQQSIRAVMHDVAAQYKIAVWLDRRLDPNRVIQLHRSDVPTTLSDELARVATSGGAKGGLIENIYVLAPADRLARIQRAAVVLHGQLASAERGFIQINHRLQWDDVISSDELLQQIARTWQIQIEGQVPHDLFHAGHFPDSTLATQLSILLGGFDLQATLIGGPGDIQQPKDNQQSKPALQADQSVRLRIGPLSEKSSWSDNYARSLTESRRIQLQNRFPDGSLNQLADKRWKVQGETNLHWELLTPIPSSLTSDDQAKPTRIDNAQQQYTFSTDQALPVEAILSHLGRSLGFQVRWSEDCGPQHRSRLIELSVKNASRKQLLQEICDLAGLTFTDQQTDIFLEPRRASP